MILVTGGAGFIGSNFVQYLTHKGENVLVVDKLTYAGDMRNLIDVDVSRLRFVEGDICDTEMIFDLLVEFEPRGIINFAAESHVDNSISDSSPFLKTNVLGTASLLEATRKYLNSHQTHKEFRFHHISTDEVYGSLGPKDPPFKETTPYAPRSPYAASKASSDHLVTAWGNTYGIPYVITNCSNNYGPKQHKEKLLPTIIRKAYNNEPIPMYGNGSNIRDWLHVYDHCEAIWKVFLDSKDKSRYNIGGKCQIPNIDMIRIVLDIMGKSSYLIQSVTDRPGHDFRYDIDTAKIQNELGFYPHIDLYSGLTETIQWYTTYGKDSWDNTGGRQVKPTVSCDKCRIKTATPHLR